MLWLIWIAVMLAVPLYAGMSVWFQLNREEREAQVTASDMGEQVSAS